MAMAHVCLGCGFDLARQRPRNEPHYGLPLIICPRCASPSVRRRHPLVARWRQFRRVDWAVSILGFKLLVALVIATATAYTVLVALLMAIHWPPPSAELIVVRSFAAWAFIALPIIVGAWITAGLNHLTRRQAWVGWGALMSTCVLCIAALLASGSAKYEFEPGTVEHVRGFFSSLLIFSMLGMTMLGAIQVCAAMGIPAGKGLLKLAALNRRLRWRRRRRRFRKVRTAA